MSIANNVILFPRMTASYMPQSMDEIEDIVSCNRMDYIDFLLNIIATGNLTDLVENGIELDKNLYVRYICVIEILRSILYEEVDGYHPMQDIMDDLVKRMMEDDETRDRIERGISAMGLK